MTDAMAGSTAPNAREFERLHRHIADNIQRLHQSITTPRDDSLRKPVGGAARIRSRTSHQVYGAPLVEAKSVPRVTLIPSLRSRNGGHRTQPREVFPADQNPAPHQGER